MPRKNSNHKNGSFWPSHNMARLAIWIFNLPNPNWLNKSFFSPWSLRILDPYIDDYYTLVDRNMCEKLGVAKSKQKHSVNSFISKVPWVFFWILKFQHNENLLLLHNWSHCIRRKRIISQNPLKNISQGDKGDEMKRSIETGIMFLCSSKGE